MGKVLNQDELVQELDLVRSNKKVVFTNGCFDILHVGHVKYLQEARAQGDLLVLGLNSDASVKRLKGESRPIQNENDRAYILSALNCVDYVCLFSEDIPLNLITKISPDVLVKGGDWAIKDIIGHELVLAKGGEVKSLQFVDGCSTTNIVEKILKS